MQRAKPETISKGLKKHLGTGPDGQRTEILISNCQSSDDPIAEKALVLMEWYVEKYINGETTRFHLLVRLILRSPLLPKGLKQ